MSKIIKAYAITDDQGEVSTFFSKSSNVYQRRVYRDKTQAKSSLDKLADKQGYRVIEILIIPDVSETLEWCPCCGADLPPNHNLKK